MAGSSERAPTPGEKPAEGGVVVHLPGVPERQPLPSPAIPPAAPRDDIDPVTGLLRLRSFLDALDGAARRRRGGDHPWAAVAMLEGASVVADRDGRLAAEELLRVVAATARASLRDSDKLARLGAEEFGILLDATSGDDAMAVLERLARRVRELGTGHPPWRGIALSVGVTQIWGDAPQRGLERAREALYSVRRRGGGTVAMSTALR